MGGSQRILNKKKVGSKRLYRTEGTPKKKRPEFVNKTARKTEVEILELWKPVNDLKKTRVRKRIERFGKSKEQESFSFFFFKKK
jgi:hypothetical protein